MPSSTTYRSTRICCVKSLYFTKKENLYTLSGIMTRLSQPASNTPFAHSKSFINAASVFSFPFNCAEKRKTESLELPECLEASDHICVIKYLSWSF